MSENIAISVNNVSKDFDLPSERRTSLKQIFINPGKKKNKEKQHSLANVSFEINKGDFFGIVGKNGSGKSTLLKIIAGVYQPTKGSVRVNGSLTPFIELGVGFNPELSGRDNVYLNGALLGFNRAQMGKIYDEIVDFAELQDEMDKKLKNYSSGMQVRLAFSIAVKAKKDILMFDEVLAVGDEAFQRKCLDVFEKYKADGQTVVLVTHDMETVKKFCNKAIIIDSAKVLEEGNPYKVAETYKSLNQEVIDAEIVKTEKQKDKHRVLHARTLDANNKPEMRFKYGESLRTEVTWSKLDPKNIESIGISIFKNSGEHITGFNSRFTPGLKKWKTSGKITLDIELMFKPGEYSLLIELFKEDGVLLEAIFDGPRFTVEEDKRVTWSGLMDLKHRWAE